MSVRFKNIIRDTSIYGIFNVLSKSISFFMLPIYTRFLSPSDYGTLEIIEISASIFEIFAGIGLTYAVFKFYHKYDEIAEKAKVVSTALTSVIVMNLTFAIIGITSSKYLTLLIFEDLSYQTYLIVIFFRIVVTGSISLGIDYLRLINKPTLYVVLSLTRLISAVVLNIVFLVILGWGVIGILLSSIISAFLVGVPMIFYLYSQFGLHFDYHKLIGMLKFGLPFIAVLIGQMGIHSADKFILQRLTNLNDVGIYSLGYRFGFLVNFMVVLPFNLMWEGKMFEIEKQNNAQEMYSKVLTYFVLALFLAFLVISLFIQEILIIMATPAFYGAAIVVPFISLAYVFGGLQEFFRLGMLLKSRTSIIGIVMFIQSIISIGLYYLFIRFMEVRGAAIAVAISYFIILSVNYFYSQRLYPIKPETKRIIKIVISAIIVVYIKYLIPEVTFFSGVLINIALIVSFIIGLAVQGFLRTEEKQLLKSTFRKIKLRSQNLF